MINLFGCCWTASSAFDVVSGKGWIQTNGISDETHGYIYFTAVYWATVTCATVGYGDIIPENTFEMSLACIVIIFGVASFSYTLSDLSNNFFDL